MLRRLRDAVLTLVLLGGLAAVVVWLDATETRSVEGRFTAVDGDSLILAGERFRLRDIDAPELRQFCQDGTAKVACGRRARDHLRTLLARSPVTCVTDGRDRYDRLLAVCQTPAEDLNERMVRDGWALAFGRYADAEASARSEGRGIWSMRFEEPRAWRRANRSQLGPTGPATRLWRAMVRLWQRWTGIEQGDGTKGKDA